MKKLFSLLALCLFVLVSCEPEPILSLGTESIEFDAAGGTQTVSVTANNTWNVLAESTDSFYTVSPQSGEGNGFITITVQPNTGTANRSGQVAVICSSRSTSMTKALTINQPCAAGYGQITDMEISALSGDKISAEGATLTMTVEANGPWTIACDAADVTFDLSEGTAGTATVVATVPACPVFEGRTLTFSVTCRTAAGGETVSRPVDQAGGVLVYGGEIYHAALMKDGKWWMTENLRYIPSGMTPSDDATDISNGVWYPLVIDELTPEKATVKFSRDEADIKANGYLYNSETALGLKTGDLTVENCKNYEGVQGICPAGWHIPTRADIIALVGKTADKNDTNENAPYYDSTLNNGNGSVALLNADGFNAGAWGAISIPSSVATKGTPMGAIKAYQGGMNTGYMAGSSIIDTGKNLTANADGSLKNCQFVGFMPNMNNGTFNGAWNNYRNAVSVRCVKNN